MPKRITVIDDADKGILTREILNFHVTEGTVTTLKRILPKFKDARGFQRGRGSLRKIIRTIGFRLRKTQSNRKILMERNDIAFQRSNYSLEIKRYRQEGRPIVYLHGRDIHSCPLYER